ncbi:MAG TPA: tetratricopeptide repeat protein, partial [Pseudolabrys sp.]
MRRLLIVIASAALAPLSALPSYAATRDQIHTCESRDDVSVDQRIAACSAVIDTSKIKRQKSIAFANRGKAYRAKGNADQAIQDFDQAITLDDHNGDAFYNRGLAF